MGWKTVRDLLPALLLHVAAAAVHVMSTVGLSGRPGALYEGALALMALVVPMSALLALLSGMRRLGAALFLLSYLGVAALTLIGHLGLDYLVTALYSDPSPYRTAFFASAMVMPLIQIHGIVESLRAWGLLAEPRRNRLLSK
ncbi:hypothetical protein [Symbiobacterium terraclitae]|uniref:hypothetical protein n=1 Tax=Symbiobacterium terraclitae TaxID=557451 RepID=UPI0035B566C5